MSSSRQVPCPDNHQGISQDADAAGRSKGVQKRVATFHKAGHVLVQRTSALSPVLQPQGQALRRIEVRDKGQPASDLGVPPDEVQPILYRVGLRGIEEFQDIISP